MTIIALITLWYPDSGTVENIRSIARQVSMAILIDNTPAKDNAALFSGISGLRYSPNRKNLGLSAAFNRHLHSPECTASDFLIFFDQDTRIGNEHVATLVKDFEMLEHTHRVGCLGPVFFDTNSGLLCGLWDGSKEVGHNCFTVPATITSSSLTRYKTLQAVGFWNERIFLDYADLDLGWRLLRAGFENFVSRNARMQHRLGKGSVPFYYALKNKRMQITYHSPVRLYYQLREVVKLLRASYVPLQGKIILIKESVSRLLARLLYLNEKGQSLCYWCRGLFDGLRNVNGALQE